jgi:hypothetical protein
MVDKVAVGQVFSEYFGFPCQSSFQQFLHDHHHLSAAGTVGHIGLEIMQLQNIVIADFKNNLKSYIQEHQISTKCAACFSCD